MNRIKKAKLRNREKWKMTDEFREEVTTRTICNTIFVYKGHNLHEINYTSYKKQAM